MNRASVRFWFLLSLAIALLYGGFALQEAFSGPTVIQDDARQHVFWMRRFLDPELFPNDLIADYFQSVAPWGYTSFYRVFALLQIDPMLVNKLVPLGLGGIAAAYGYGIALGLLPIPAAAFLSTALLNQYLWSNDDIASGTARGFMLPLMLAFVYYLMRLVQPGNGSQTHAGQADGGWGRSLLLLLLVIGLEGLFYPSYVLVFAGILLLLPLRWQKGQIRWSPRRRDAVVAIAGLLVAFLVLLPNLLVENPYGPIISVAEARQLGDFSGLGRTSFFFDDNPWLFWFSARRSGFLTSIKPPLIALGILLPLLLRLPNRFPLVRQVSPQVGILGRWGVAAIALFLLAHALLFRLYLPSRYTHYSLQLILTFATGMVLAILLEAGLRWVSHRGGAIAPRAIVGGSTLLIGAAILFFPYYTQEFPRAEYRVGQFPPLYEFLQQQPKETLVASVLPEADSISSLALRPVYISREHAIPYHVGYGTAFRQRASDLIRALYTPDLAVLQAFIQSSGVDYWLISSEEFTPRFLERYWIRQYREAIAQAQQDLQQGPPAIARLQERCTVLTVTPQPLDPVTQSSLREGSESWLQTRAIAVVESDCLLRSVNEGGRHD